MATSETTAITRRKEEPLLIIKWWNNLSDFLHQARLIPFIIAVSGYHYFQVLKTHDEVFTAWPVAIFLDLLHYRTVQQAVETRKPLWGVAAVLTTAVAYAFQFIFYSGTGRSGEYLPVWQQFLFASVVPIGIAFMVWHHHENGQKVESTLQADLDRTQAELTTTQTELNQLQTETKTLKESLQTTQNELKTTQTTLNETQTDLSKTQTVLDETQRTLTTTQTESTSLRGEQEASDRQLHSTQTELNQTQLELVSTQQGLQNAMSKLGELEMLEKIWGSLNKKTQSAAKVAAGILSLDEAVELTEIPKETIRRHAKNMNGMTG
jgi:peptidoglycan hydrolase CwlO-like protein